MKILFRKQEKRLSIGKLIEKLNCLISQEAQVSHEINHQLGFEIEKKVQKIEAKKNDLKIEKVFKKTVI